MIGTLLAIAKGPLPKKSFTYNEAFLGVPSVGRRLKKPRTDLELLSSLALRAQALFLCSQNSGNFGSHKGLALNVEFCV